MGRIERENLEGEVICFEDTVSLLSIIYMEILSRLFYGDLQSGWKIGFGDTNLEVVSIFKISKMTKLLGNEHKQKRAEDSVVTHSSFLKSRDFRGPRK